MANKGILYEKDLETDWKDLKSVSAAGSGHGMDLVFYVDNTPINVEVKYIKDFNKGGNLDFGQADFETNRNRWTYVPAKTESGIQIREIFEEANAIDWVNRQWNADIDLLEIMKTAETVHGKRALKKKIVEEQGYKDLYVNFNAPPPSDGGQIINDDIESDFYGGYGAINRYYSKKGAEYVQIKHHGLFRLGDADPLGDALKRKGYTGLSDDKITPLHNIEVKIRARIKGKGSKSWISIADGKEKGLPELPESHKDYHPDHPYGKEPRIQPYRFTMALRGSGFSRSNVDLTGPTQSSGDSNSYTGPGAYRDIIKILRPQS